jgi:hypothetical protein
MLRRHHATTVKIVINKQKPRGLTIPTELVQKHAEKILPGNGKAITNFNILAKTSPGHRFPIPYLDTFSIAGSRIDGLKIVFQTFVVSWCIEKYISSQRIIPLCDHSPISLSPQVFRKMLRLS